MDVIDESSSPEAVVYRVPMHQWVGGIVRFFFVLIIVTMLVMTVWLALVVVPWPSHTAPSWFFLTGPLALVLIPFLAWRFGQNELHHSIALHENHLTIGVGQFSRSVWYDGIRVLELRRLRKTVHIEQLVIQSVTHRPLWIALPSSHAEEGFDALRHFCDRALVIRHGTELARPSNRRHHGDGLLMLAASLRRRSWWGITIASFAAIWLTFIILALAVGTANRHSNSIGPWHLLAVLPLTIVGSLASAIRDRRAARAHTQKAMDTKAAADDDTAQAARR